MRQPTSRRGMADRCTRRSRRQKTGSSTIVTAELGMLPYLSRATNQSTMPFFGRVLSHHSAAWYDGHENHASARGWKRSTRPRRTSGQQIVRSLDSLMCGRVLRQVPRNMGSKNMYCCHIVFFLCCLRMNLVYPLSPCTSYFW